METRLMSLTNTPPKCALCSDIFALNTLSPQDFINIRSALQSHIPELAGLLDNGTTLCRQCDVFMKEAARLHLLLQTLTTQLNSIILSIRTKIAEKSLQITQHEEEETILPFNEELPHVLSPILIKQDNQSEEDYYPPDCSEFLDSDQQASLSSILTSVDDSNSDSYQLPSKSRPTVTRTNIPNNCKVSSSKNEDKDFLCTVCSIHFTRKEDKFLHYESFHFKGASEDVPGECQLYSRICGKSSLTPGDLSRHNETFHESFFKFFCLGCTPHRKFTSIDLLQAHQPIHDDSLTSFSCCICPSYLPVTFDTPLCLDNHILRVHTHLPSTSDTDFHAELDVNEIGPECRNINLRDEESTTNQSDTRLGLKGDVTLTDSKRKRRFRAKSTPEQRAKAAERKRLARARATPTRTPEQKADENRRKKAARANLTPEQRAAEVKRKQAARAKLTPEQRAQAAEKRRLAFTPEKRAAEVKRKQAARAKLTLEQRAQAAEKRRLAVTPEQRAADVRRKQAARARAILEQNAHEEDSSSG